MKKSKGLSLTLTAALVLSNATVIGAETTKGSTTPSSDVLKEVQKIATKNAKKVSKKEEAKTFGLNEQVRVIVEATGQAPLEYATEQGVLYKDLSSTTKKSLQKKVVDEQTKLKTALKQKGVSAKYEKKFATAFNGFSATVAYRDIAKIKATKGVKNVYIANEYERPTPSMTTSHEFIQSTQTWRDAGFKGQGMVVSVIDTGVDPTHKDFVLSADTNEKLTKSGVEATATEKGLKGKFYTEKVPYGYNYFDNNNTILDLGPEASEHGMHVAGTVAANGGATGGIDGVAPEAQVLGMKVFSNDPNFPSTYSDIYLAAIDESIALGADVVNMSLGSTAAFYESKSPEDLAITRAVKNGIVCAVSAGNSGHIGHGYSLPYYQNPDIGVVGSPGLNADTIQVAASGNLSLLYTHELKNEAVTVKGYGVDSWKDVQNPDLVTLTTANGTLALGQASDYVGKDVKDKVVIVARGSISFNEKTLNAKAAGAKGIIVVDHGLSTFFKDQGGWGIPFMHVSKADGAALVQAVKENTGGVYSVAETNRSESEDTGRMTDFTSWGVTPSLELKPEITAPGGKIYSTLQNNEYGMMSGTSMAAPHVAGGAALVQQYLKADKRFKKLSTKKRTELAKTLLMNTASVIEDKYGQPFSPRRQGAGMMQTYSAVTTPVYVVNTDTKKPKFELGEFKGKRLTLNVSATNISDKTVKYEVNTDVLADSFAEGNGETVNPLISMDVKDVKVTGAKTLTIKPGEIRNFTVSINLSKAKITGFDKDGNEVVKPLPKNAFVEGFVSLKDTAALQPTLSLPYVGFYGEWDEPAIVDGLTGEENNFFSGAKYYGPAFSDVLTSYQGDANFVGTVEYEGETAYPVSPNGDGFNDDVLPYLSFLRNAKEVQYNVLSESGKLLRKVNVESDVRKSYTNGGSKIPFEFNDSAAWNGEVNESIVKDGLYYYEVKSVVDYKGSKYQSKQIPILVDTTAPTLNASYDEDTKKLSWEASDEGSGVQGTLLIAGGKTLADLPGDVTEYDMSQLKGIGEVTVVTYDNVYNVSATTVLIPEKNAPVIYLNDNAPTASAVYNTTEIPVAGYVTEDTKLQVLQANGEDVPFTFDEAKKQYNFNSKVQVDGEGKQIMNFKAVDVFGNETEFARHFYVDTTAPIALATVPSAVNRAKTTVTFTLTDNLGFVNFYVNGNNEYKNVLDETKILTPTNKKVKVTLNLERGENKIKTVIRDAAGNETVKEYTITRTK